MRYVIASRYASGAEKVCSVNAQQKREGVASTLLLIRLFPVGIETGQFHDEKEVYLYDKMINTNIKLQLEGE